MMIPSLPPKYREASGFSAHGGVSKGVVETCDCPGALMFSGCGNLVTTQLKHTLPVRHFLACPATLALKVCRQALVCIT